jgi:hypothetical protein
VINNQLVNEFRSEETFIIIAESKDDTVVTKRGTCFLISDSLVVTAKHNINGCSKFHCFVNSDAHKADNKILLEFKYQHDDLDFAILKLSHPLMKSGIPVGEKTAQLGDKFKCFGYPVEKGVIPQPINVIVTNLYKHIKTHNYSFEVSQSSTVKNYKGMSGSPVLYKGYVIGLLVVQQTSTTLKVISLEDIMQELGDLKEEFSLDTSMQEEMDYQSPEHAPSPFKIRINCNAGVPNIKGLDIGFDYNVWRLDDFVTSSCNWLYDYSLSAEQKSSLSSVPWNAHKAATKQFRIDDVDAISDLLLHIAIRSNHKTIPIINKCISTEDGSAFSCSHIVLDKGNVEIWLGASAINKNLESAVQYSIKNIELLFNINCIKERLLLITSNIDKNWPFKDKLMKISDNSIPFEDRFDRLVIPVFISHESELISSYDTDSFIEMFTEEIHKCRDIIQSQYASKIIPIIDLKVFVFPISDIDALHEKFKEELLA